MGWDPVTDMEEIMRRKMRMKKAKNKNPINSKKRERKKR